MKIDLPALRAALATLEAHETLIQECIHHEADGAISIHPRDIYAAFGSAVHAIVDDEWRPTELLEEEN